MSWSYASRPTQLTSLIATYPPNKQPNILKHLITRDPKFNYIHLKLSGRYLNDLPKGLFEVKELEYLDLSPERQSGLFFHLSSIPPQIGDLKQLRVLCLDTNELKRVPSELGNLENLQILALSNNLLTSLPEELVGLKSLKSLHLANNYFSSIPDCIFTMEKLEFLDMSDNKISEIPEKIADLKNLEALIMMYNIIRQLPETIVSCPRLRSLWLGRNRLTSLPKNFGYFKRLDWEDHMHSCNINGNLDLEDPPIQVCMKGLKAIREYFENEDEPEVEDLEVDEEEDDNDGSEHSEINVIFKAIYS